jgi:nucleoside-diphosphate-sugar epimerase
VYHLPSGPAARALDVVGRLNGLLGTDVPPLLAGPCSTAPPAPLPDVSRARAELGFSADVCLDEGLRRCLAQYRPATDEADVQPIGASAAIALADRPA